MEIFTRIKDYPRYVISSHGRAFRIRKKGLVELKRFVGKNGYEVVNVYPEGWREGDKHNITYVHRLIAEHFIENKTGCNSVRHLNDIKTDNTIENLRWGSKLDNARDAVRNGRVRSLENHGMAKLTNSQVLSIKEMISKKEMTQIKIAELFGAHPSTISYIKTGKQWGGCRRI